MEDLYYPDSPTTPYAAAIIGPKEEEEALDAITINMYQEFPNIEYFYANIFRGRNNGRIMDSYFVQAGPSGVASYVIAFTDGERGY